MSDLPGSTLQGVAAAIYAEYENRPLYAQGQMNGVLALELARAAVEALREPIEGMVDAWSDAEEYIDHPAETYLNPRRYAAMIDRILKEG